MFRVFPAPAGINRALLMVGARGWSVPRASGDNRGSISSGFADTRVPRASGDKPTWSWVLLLQSQCSPRQRG